MNIPRELWRQWKEEWLVFRNCAGTQPFPLFMAEKSADWMQERCAKICDELRVKGGGEWSSDHLGALKALTDASAAIRALEPAL